MLILNIVKLAKKLNLSPTTVSRALGGYSDVSETTRKRVKEFASRYNYNPNPYASNLASNKSNAVGFVIPLYGLNNNTLNQISYFKFVAGMSSKINQDNILFYMLFAKSAKEEMDSYKKLIEINKVKNIIIHNVQTDDERIDYLNKNKINFVAWGRSKNINYSWVDLDNELSTELIVDHLYSKGHHKFAFINVSEKYNFAYLRKKGFKNGLKKYSLKFYSNLYKTTSLEDPSHSKKITIDLLTKNPDLKCIICSTEYSSVGVIQACVELGKTIGKDISLVTFDGPVVESLTNPQLSAVSHPLEELGTNAIKILMHSEKNFKQSSYLVTPKIIDRGSVQSLIK
jgi:LacI family transcriptional regulator|tara:strand:+ start:5662 stop:6687 length:1026 start_codon:yes stop_codon:yes gene_type:complete